MFLRRRGANLRAMDVALSRITKAVRVRTLVQVSREGSSLNHPFIRSRRFCASLSHLKMKKITFSSVLIAPR